VDADVLSRARAGSGEAFSVLYADLAGPVAAYLRAKGVTDVEDLTSEVFLAVFTGLGRFEGDVAGFRSWVFTIAHRRVVDHWRRRGRRPASVPYEADDDERAEPSAESAALAKIGYERALALLDLLTEAQREVLVLRIVGELTVEEVAQVVDRPAGAVKQLQRRGLATVRRILAAEGVTL
jgi:RNA polymerase sigma factor (sigma-70 family)